MTVAVLIHIVCAFVWLGCVLVEAMLERAGKRAFLPRRLVRAAWRLDLFVELPAFLGVLVTGAYMANILPATPLLTTNVAAGLVAVGACVYGVLVVYRRLSTSWAGQPVMDRSPRLYGVITSIAILISVAIGAHLISG